MLAPGSRIGPYEVLAPLGAGGMGEVYRARDTTLPREVALKTLPEKVAREPNRLARLRREARILASLSHPGIAVLHGLEDSGDGVPVLVMELVRGETLADRLHRGPLPLKEALHVGQQVAEALAWAHEKGVLHRDLKPGNISLTPEGRVKVLDFGLARALEDGEPELHSQLSTATSPPSDASRVLGTAPYMSPEQARGQEVDRRTDIWAFGCLLYELLAGKRAFPGATFSETAAAILEREPDWSALPEATPPNLLRLLRRCLKKDRDERLHDINDAGLELKELLAEASSDSAIAGPSIPSAPLTGTTSRSKKRSAAIAALLVAGCVLGSAVLYLSRPKVPTVALRQPRFQLTLPRGLIIPQPASPVSFLAISPDGERVAFVARPARAAAMQLLYVRERRELDARPLQDTEGAICPFFSPDGRVIGFGANGKLKRVSVDGGPAVIVAEAAQLRGGSWGEDDTILFTHGNGGLMRVAAAGGEVSEVTKLDPKRDLNHRWPQFLPGGRAALFAITRSEGQDVAVVDFTTGRIQTLFERAGYPRYAPTGHLLFGRGGIVYAARFDVERLALAGPAVAVLDGVVMWSHPAVSGGSGVVYYDLAQDGTLLFSPLEARLPKRTVVWVNRRGGLSAASSAQRLFEPVILLDDGHRLATTVSEDGVSSDVFVLDLQRDIWTRVTSDNKSLPVAWLPDGSGLLAFSGSRSPGSPPGLRLVRIDGSVPPQTLLEGQTAVLAVAPDSRSLLYCLQARLQWDIWRLPLDGDRVAQPWLATPAQELSPSFSPDGRFVAYHSNDSGRYEVYVRSYIGSGPRHQVSLQGGLKPRWSRDGREIFFIGLDDSMLAASVATPPTRSSEAPRELFKIPDEIVRHWGRFYDVAPDGQRFVMIQKDPFEVRPLELALIPDWLEELKAKMAAVR